MNTLDYIDVLRATAIQADLDPELLSAEDLASLRTLHSLRLATLWEDQEWPELLPGPEQRYFRNLYDAALGYAAGAEVFYIGPRGYYQALTTVPVGQAPATFAGSSWTTNTTYWATSASQYSALEYNNSATYARGDRVFYTPTARYYQLHAASSVGNLPTSTAHWGLLTEFNRYVAFEQTGRTAFTHAFRAWDENPELSGRAREVEAWTSRRGVQILEAVPWVWLEYRSRCPILSGATFSTTATYVAGQQVLFSSATTRGNFYDALATTSAGESPDTTPAKWSRVEIPRFGDRYLVHGAAADYLRPENQEASFRHASMAESCLEQARLLFAGQLLRRRRPSVHSR